jgi:putative flippase GtrA
MSGSATAQRRLARFSMVGAIGIVVQLAMLSLLSVVGANYLLATIVAVESAILHNFIWHRFFTWPDRKGSLAETISAFLRFNLSNGLISMVGNILLMRMFRGELHLPLLLANLLSISVCAIANFAISDHWVFISGGSPNGLEPSNALASAPGFAAQRGDKSARP